MQHVTRSDAAPATSHAVLAHAESEAEPSATKPAKPGCALPQSASETASELGPSPSASPHVPGMSAQHVSRSATTLATSHAVSTHSDAEAAAL